MVVGDSAVAASVVLSDVVVCVIFEVLFVVVVVVAVGVGAGGPVLLHVTLRSLHCQPS